MFGLIQTTLPHNMNFVMFSNIPHSSKCHHQCISFLARIYNIYYDLGDHNPRVLIVWGFCLVSHHKSLYFPCNLFFKLLRSQFSIDIMHLYFIKQTQSNTTTYMSHDHDSINYNNLCSIICVDINSFVFSILNTFTKPCLSAIDLDLYPSTFPLVVFD